MKGILFLVRNSVVSIVKSKVFSIQYLKYLFTSTLSMKGKFNISVVDDSSHTNILFLTCLLEISCTILNTLIQDSEINSKIPSNALTE